MTTRSALSANVSILANTSDGNRPSPLDWIQRLVDVQVERDQLKRTVASGAAALSDKSLECAALSRRLEQALLRIKSLEVEGPEKSPGSQVIAIDGGVIDTFSFWMIRWRILLGLTRRLLLGRRAEVRSLVRASLIVHKVPPDVTSVVALPLSTRRVIFRLIFRRLLTNANTARKAVETIIDENMSAHDMRLLSGHDLARRYRALEIAKIADEQALLTMQIALAKLRQQKSKVIST